METLADITWRLYPAVVMLTIGGVMTFFGARREIAGLRAPFSDKDKTLRMMTGFRMAIVGLALVLFAAAWIAEVTWLMWLAAIIGIGELIESSLMASGIRTGMQAAEEQERRKRRRAVDGAAANSTDNVAPGSP